MSYHTAAIAAIVLTVLGLGAQLWIDHRCRRRAWLAEVENYLREGRP